MRKKIQFPLQSVPLETTNLSQRGRWDRSEARRGLSNYGDLQRRILTLPVVLLSDHQHNCFISCLNTCHFTLCRREQEDSESLGDKGDTIGRSGNLAIPDKEQK